MSKISPETVPKIFFEPREKRSTDAKPLNLTKKPVVESIIKRKNKPVDIKDDNTAKCMARVATNNQCGRTQKDGYDYCGCHVKHLPYGRFDGPIEGKKFLNVPKKRGPRFKNSKEYSLDELDSDLYIKTQLVQVDNEYYLLDKYGILYKNDPKAIEIVGRHEDDSIIWFV